MESFKWFQDKLRISFNPILSLHLLHRWGIRVFLWLIGSTKEEIDEELDAARVGLKVGQQYSVWLFFMHDTLHVSSTWLPGHSLSPVVFWWNEICWIAAGIWQGSRNSGWESGVSWDYNENRIRIESKYMKSGTTDQSPLLPGMSPWEFHQADFGRMKWYLGTRMQFVHFWIIDLGNNHPCVRLELVLEDLDGIHSQPWFRDLLIR